MKKIMTISLKLLVLVAFVCIGGIAGAETEDIANPEKFPYPPNDQYGNYEPTITANRKTIYFARFAVLPDGDEGDPRVNGSRDIFVTERISGHTWPGEPGDWTEPVPVDIPDPANPIVTINTEYMETEPVISPDGHTLYFSSDRPGSVPQYEGGPPSRDVWVSEKQPDGTWGVPENLGPAVNTSKKDHCLMPGVLPGEGNVFFFASNRSGGAGKNDIYITKKVGGEWQQARRIESDVINTGQSECRLISTIYDGIVLGVITVHKQSGNVPPLDVNYHHQVLVRYDLETKKWVGPRVKMETGTIQSEGCPFFTVDGNKMIISSGRDRYPYAEYGDDHYHPGLFDIFSWDTQAVVDYYRAQTGIDE